MGAMKKRILIVEDDKMTRKLLDHLLSAYYDVCEASDGDEALNMIEQDGLPDLVLTDLEMPELSGIEMIEVIRATPRTHQLPVIVVSGADISGMSQRLDSNNISSFLSKPIDPKVLYWRVEEALNTASVL